MSSLNKGKGGKIIGMDDIVLKIFRNGVITIIYWLLRIFNRCMKLVGTK